MLIDDIVQTEADDMASMSFTVPHDELEMLQAAVGQAIKQLGAGSMTTTRGLAKVSAVGVGMRTHTGVAATMFNALAEAGIAIRSITTSEIKISCIVDAAHGPDALRALHTAFGLEGEPGQRTTNAGVGHEQPEIEVKLEPREKSWRPGV